MGENWYNYSGNHIKSSKALEAPCYPFSSRIRGAETMTDHTTRQSPEVKIKLCECGCGQPTNIARKTDTSRGHVRGQPYRYLPAHNTTKPRLDVSNLPRQAGTKLIPLTKGKVAVVDEADYAALSQYKWSARKDGNRYYAERNSHLGDGTRIHVQMHQEILGEKYTDHINGDGLDCRRENLRPATHSQNRYNRGAQSNNTSGYKGVIWDKKRLKWQANIQASGKRFFRGYFGTAEDAARAYDEMALVLHGEFAKLNFPR